MRHGKTLSPRYLTADNVRTLATAVVLVQAVGAVLTFTPKGERQRGVGVIPLVAYLLVIVGSRRAELFEAAVIPGCIGLASAVGLFLWARLATRGRIFSYIGNTDIPEFICMDGPYRWVRHPFYSSYLLTLVSMAVMFPSATTILGTIAGVLAFTRSAKFEEAKFENSPLAAEYRAYMERSGRFLPGL